MRQFAGLSIVRSRTGQLKMTDHRHLLLIRWSMLPDLLVSGTYHREREALQSGSRVRW